MNESYVTALCSFDLLKSAVLKVALTLGAFSLAACLHCAPIANAQTAPAPARQIGTVKSIATNKLTVTTDAGISLEVNIATGARALQLAPGSTDLKSAQTIAFGDIEIGDRVLVTGHQDAPDALTASRIILMKATDLAEKHATEQEDWQKRGMGGLVAGVDPAGGTITITSRGNKIAVQTSLATIFRRYANGSVKYEDAQPGTLAQIEPGDQLRVRGAKSTGSDGKSTSVAAEEIVSGAFKNLAGTIVSVDAASETLTLKDLVTNKTYPIKVSASSSLHALPPEAAARFAARAKAGQGSGPAAGAQSPQPPLAGVAAGDLHSGAGSAGGDLSQIVSRLPPASISDLHPGQAVMVVASDSQSGGGELTAITLLSGVEPILAATPKGAASMTLSPWNFGSSDSGGGM